MENETEKEGIFASYLSKILNLFRNQKMSREEENNILIEHALNNTSNPNGENLTKEDYLLILDSIDNTNEAINEYYSEYSDTDADKWGGSKIKTLAKEIMPDAVDKKIDNEIEKGLDLIIEDESIATAEVLAGRELTEDEIKDAKKEEE